LPQSDDWGIILERKDLNMKKIFLILALVTLAGCCNCEVEPIVEQNHKLIVPPNFGNMPK